MVQEDENLEYFWSGGKRRYFEDAWKENSSIIFTSLFNSSISIEALENMFVLDQLTILSEVNLLLVQGIVEAS